MRLKVLSSAALVAMIAAACTSTSSAPPVASYTPAPPMTSVPTGPTFDGPLLGPDGRCTGVSTSTATVIEPGIAECDLVRIKGKPATDVLVGESGKGQREVQVLYSEPGGRELYFFVNNRLDRIAKP
ncbi:hypothetical protein AB4Y85_13235 [Microvirga sp. 2YAF29]|uniref:hypothetical protein n=1 Tax=Microvirga sp. 2YAF29 TaxID=3233031 RepID=UPI003F96F513